MLAEPEASRSNPFDGGNAVPEMFVLADVAAGDILEQAGAGKDMRG